MFHAVQEYEVGEPSECATLPAASPAQPAGGRAPFIAAVAFAGARSGYVFTKGAQGVGYYVDTDPMGNGIILSDSASAADQCKKMAGASPLPLQHTLAEYTQSALTYWCPSKNILRF